MIVWLATAAAGAVNFLRSAPPCAPAIWNAVLAALETEDRLHLLPAGTFLAICTTAVEWAL
jgi:hypothetical protein